MNFLPFYDPLDIEDYSLVPTEIILGRTQYSHMYTDTSVHAISQCAREYGFRLCYLRESYTYASFRDARGILSPKIQRTKLCFVARRVRPTKPTHALQIFYYRRYVYSVVLHQIQYVLFCSDIMLLHSLSLLHTGKWYKDYSVYVSSM